LQILRNEIGFLCPLFVTSSQAFLAVSSFFTLKTHAADLNFLYLQWIIHAIIRTPSPVCFKNYATKAARLVFKHSTFIW